MARDTVRYEVVIVGTGRAGTALAAAFHDSDIPVAMVSRTKRRLKREPPIFTADHPACPRGAPFVVLAVPDGAIADGARRMLEAGVIGPRTRVGHLSGAFSSSILTPLVPAERTFSAHPLGAFSSMSDHNFVHTFYGTTVMVEASDEKTRKAVMKLFKKASAIVATIERDQKPLYHAGAVVGTTFPYLNLLMCGKILERCGVPDPVRVAVELLDDTMGNLASTRDVSGLTGPFARGDVETIASNLRSLDAFSGEIAALYRLQGRIVTRILRDSGQLSQETWEAIQKVLGT